MKDLDLSVFEKSNKSDWLQLAQNQLKGDDPMTKLSWESSGLNGLLPYYDSSDLDGLTYLNEFFTQLPSHRWKLYERIDAEEVKQSNTQALDALMGGCDGIIFDLKTSIESSELLKNIDISICDISFFSEQEVEASGLTGMLHAGGSKNVFTETKPHSSVIEQVKELLSNASGHRFIHRTGFSDFFVEIAAIRALRYLLEQQKLSIHIHTSVPAHESEEHQWFLNTTIGLASILGGSHSIDMHTATGDPRITRNVGNLIREESKITEYQDQCGGAYLVEALTDQIIKEVAK